MNEREEYERVAIQFLIHTKLEIQLLYDALNRREKVREVEESSLTFALYVLG